VSAGEVGRFAPSTTGPAHPGTLLAALLCWLDARSRGARVWLRLEDLDPERSRPEWTSRMHADLAWLGLDWDHVEEQRGALPRHEAALDRLAALGRLYPCACSRRDVRAAGAPAPDGGFRYPGTCRGRPLGPGGWRASEVPLRVCLPEGRLAITDESGLDLSQDPAAAFGDPVVRRRDGAVAYHLASVVDDAACGVTRVVRGRDLAPSTATQVALQALLGLPRPRYRHHFLLLEEHGGKLAKLHGAVDLEHLRPAYDAPALCGWLARAAGLQGAPAPLRPADLVADFAWERVATRDRVVRLSEGRLVLAAEVS
jgi:glutamyl-tRNA synthetase/glutamyl-Q tRNA(Asp) synthetase